MKYINVILSALVSLTSQCMHGMEIDHIKSKHFGHTHTAHIKAALHTWHRAASKRCITAGMARTFAILSQKTPTTLIHNQHALIIANQLYRIIFAAEQAENSWQTLHAIANLPGFQSNKFLAAQTGHIAFQIRTVNALQKLYPAFNAIALSDLQPFAAEDNRMPYAAQYLAYNTDLNPHEFENYANALLLLGAFTAPKKQVLALTFQ